MIIERVVPMSLVLRSVESIQYALSRINANKMRMIFCVSEENILEGVLTDGDFRRWVLQNDTLDLSRPALEACNKDYISASINASPNSIREKFTNGISALPLIDDKGRLAGLARTGPNVISIGSRKLADDEPSFLIAEIGNNHNGSFELACKLAEEALIAGADCAKFQMRNMAEIYRPNANTGSEDLGTEYTLDLLAKFQLDQPTLMRVFDYCHKIGIIPMCTPWDEASLAALNTYGMQGYKIASADLTNYDLIRAVASTGKPMILSTGMSTEAEIRQTVLILKQIAAPFILLNCNSTYPTPMQDVNLSYMQRLKEIGQCLVGYSGHERGIEVPIAAVSLGAKVIEKHITIDREMEGNDHRVSLLPTEFKQMVSSIRNIELALGTPNERRITQGERINRENLAKSLVATQELPVGTIIQKHHLEARSPGRGLQPNYLNKLLGRQTTRHIKRGGMFFQSDIDGVEAKPRPYKFGRPWGIPVRYHDIAELAAVAQPDFVELHFSYRDINIEPGQYFESPSEMGLIVHAPELFAGDHILDLANDRSEYRERSIAELQRVIDRTSELSSWFPSTSSPLIVVNVGGFTEHEFIPVSSRRKLYDRVADAFERLQRDNVEIIPQTMPPYPWHFGGQRFHNLFIDPDEIATFCEVHATRVCLDISHSALACNLFNWSLGDFIEKVGPFSAHLHIVDARGHFDEGLQIGDGDIDFKAVGRLLSKFAPTASFIPEIWQGHKNGGEGFWRALDQLEMLLQSGQD